VYADQCHPEAEHLVDTTWLMQSTAGTQASPRGRPVSAGAEETQAALPIFAQAWPATSLPKGTAQPTPRDSRGPPAPRYPGGPNRGLDPSALASALSRQPQAWLIAWRTGMCCSA
jgi:hypothetical protein